MTTNDIDAIRKLTDAATPGPWSMRDGWGPSSQGAMRFRRIANKTHDGVIEATDQGELAALLPNAEFIAAARTLVPALCDEIEQLRARLGRMSGLTEGQYLIWSHKQCAWWGPGGHGYRWDISRAGRFPLDRAKDHASTRSWPAGQKTPPEVVIPAPPLHILADPERIDGWINEQVKQATEQKIAERAAAINQETQQ